MTKKGIYSLEANPEGGGGIYSYDAAQSQFEKDCRDGEGGYPISVNVQNIYHMKESVGEIIFLVNEEYLFGALKSSGDSYVLLEHGEIRKYWGDLSEKKQSSDIMAHWMIYECSTHGNRIEIGFQTLDVILENWPVFLLVTGMFFMVAGMMFFWMRRMTKGNEEFLEEFIHVIQLAKKGEFQRIKVRKRKDSYAMLALEINDMLSKLDVHIKKEYILKGMQQDAEMKAMLYQINPHFLYNTLDSIRGVALVHDVPQIAQMTEALSKLFRCMIANEGKMVSLKDEIQSVENYMLIQQFRFDGRISYQMNLDDEELLSCHVPNLIIQPIVENSVIHGLECREGGGTVSLSGYATQNRLVILVEDNGLGIPQDKLDRLNEELFHAYSLQTLGAEKEKHRGIALLNISQRIKLHYGNDYGVSIMSTPNVSTIVEITLPAIRNPRGGVA